MTYTIGSLVRARGREWVVLPESDNDWLLLRPLGGTDREMAGLYLPLEGSDVQPATFDLPDPDQPGDFRSCRLLRDAVRLGFRSSAGPFRSFARIAVEPRPYQLVPLLMALKLDPVRLLIADDVGIGKTVEAGLIARELLDRGEVQRLAVLCPPHLAEQWQQELATKFHIEAELVLPSTVGRLERGTGVGQSLFDLYPFVVVSTDYIKSSRRRDEFVRTCPRLVIVDEAHTCAFSAEQRGGRHLRHQLLKDLVRDPTRHMLLVTATPHSGDEGAFRSLLALLKPEFARLPDDMTGRPGESHRRAVAVHLVQRRRADVRAYQDVDTPFPERQEAEETYTFGNEYKKLFLAVLSYARERVSDGSGSRQHQRVRWWSALALLRSVGSSPAAAAATLRARSSTIEAASPEEVDAIGERSVLDLDDLEATEYMDAAPGAQEADEEEPTPDGGAQTTMGGGRDRLLRMARMAEGLRGPEQDAKLRKAIALVKDLVKGGYQPILFCRFIPTAEYVAQELRRALPGDVEVAAVTGLLPPADREARVQQLGGHARRVLVATDCLSEGINLQEQFNAVLHYDLSWNPTRHEQREGRVDRYGQPRDMVRTLTFYGADSPIDGLVLEVLLRKHRTIRSATGVSVPVPADTAEVTQALVHGLLLRDTRADTRQLALFDLSADAYRDLHTRWDVVAEQERKSRTLFAQHAIDVAEVTREWQAMRAAVGTHIDVERFVEEAVTTHGGVVTRPAAPGGHGAVPVPVLSGGDFAARGAVDVQMPNRAALRDACQGLETFRARFELPVSDGVIHLSRTHPIVEGLATYVMDTALDPLLEGIARRCGAIRTRAVQQRTTLLLVRCRYHIEARDGDGTGGGRPALLAEECQVWGYAGAPESARWLPPEEAEALLEAQPDANTAPQQASEFIRRVVDGFAHLRAALDAAAEVRGQQLLEAHRRVRAAVRLKGIQYAVQPQLPPDVMGVYVLLPAVTSL